MSSYYHSLIILCYILSIIYAAPARTCIDQHSCLDVTIVDKPDHQYKVCLILNNKKEECLKDTMSYACDHPSHKYEPWVPYYPLCKKVDCGSEAQFGIKDGKGCRDSEPLDGLIFGTVTNVRCEFDMVAEGYCNGGNQESCTWTIPVPPCPEEATTTTTSTTTTTTSTTPQPQILCDPPIFLCEDGSIVREPKDACIPLSEPCPFCVPEGGTLQGNADECQEDKSIPSCIDGYIPWYDDCGCGCILRPECVVPPDGIFVDYIENCDYKTCDEGYELEQNDICCYCVPKKECVLPPGAYLLDDYYKACKYGYKLVYDDICGCYCEPITCPTDTYKCTDGTILTRDPFNHCEFPSCPDPPVYWAKSSGGLTDNSDAVMVNHKKGVNDFEFLLLNTGTSAGACLLILVGCWGFCYLKKKCNGKKIYNTNKKDIDDDTESEDEQQGI